MIDPLFKGCTRPAMFLGVPLVPLLVAGMIIILLSLWVTIFFIILLLPMILVMRWIVKSDDQQFRLLELKCLFRLVNRNYNDSFWQASTYAPLQFKKRN